MQLLIHICDWEIWQKNIDIFEGIKFMRQDYSSIKQAEKSLALEIGFAIVKSTNAKSNYSWSWQDCHQLFSNCRQQLVFSKPEFLFTLISKSQAIFFILIFFGIPEFSECKKKKERREKLLKCGACFPIATTINGTSSTSATKVSGKYLFHKLKLIKLLLISGSSPAPEFATLRASRGARPAPARRQLGSAPLQVLPGAEPPDQREVPQPGLAGQRPAAHCGPAPPGGAQPPGADAQVQSVGGPSRVQPHWPLQATWSSSSRRHSGQDSLRLRPTGGRSAVRGCNPRLQRPGHW